MIVGIDEQVQMRSKLVVAVVVLALDRRVLDRAVHPLDLSVIRHDDPPCPRVPLIFGSALW